MFFQIDSPIIIKLESPKNKNDYPKNSSINKNSSLKQGFSIYLKILLNYLQMIGIIHSMDLKWPFYANDYLSVTTKVGVSTTEIVSLQCVLDDFGITAKFIHVKALIFVLIPFYITFSIILLLSLICIFTKKPQSHRLIVGIVVLSVYLQPLILQNLFDNINTTKLNAKNYLTKELTLSYDDEDHQKWVNNLKNILLNHIINFI